jgi:mRNA-degrading endonuclease YafQ of YafQ-DinJ toxin-antitoxin module
MRPVFTHGFVRDYQRLPQLIQRRFDRALRFFLSNSHYPSLRTKKMEGQRDTENRDIWEARITKDHRFTFAVDKNSETYIFYRIGGHDILRRPL